MRAKISHTPRWIFVVALLAVTAAAAYPLLRRGPADIPTAGPTATALPEATPEPTNAPDQCVIGRWQMEDLTGFAISIPASWLGIPSAWMGRQTVSVSGTSGDMVFEFTPEGAAETTASKHRTDAVLGLGAIQIKLALLLEGASQAAYETDPDLDVIAFTQPEGGDMRMNLVLGGLTVISQTKIDDLPVVEKAKRVGLALRYECSPDTLTLEIEPPGEVDPPQRIVLKRLP